MHESSRLEGKVAIVTGAARGMGAAHVRRLAAEGAFVVAGDVEAVGVADLPASDRARVSTIELDVTDQSSWAGAVAHAERHFARVDVLVNNAGIALGSGGNAEDIDLADLRRVFEVNVLGALQGVQAVLPGMKTMGRGSIINIGSVSGLRGWYKAIGYSASKHALTGLTRSLALELGEFGIRVNAVHPGLIQTPMTGGRTYLTNHVPLQRAGLPDDVAGLVCYLASDAASYSTGADFVVDGGESAGRPSGSFVVES